MRTLVLYGLASLLWLQSPGVQAEILHFEYSVETPQLLNLEAIQNLPKVLMASAVGSVS